MHPSCRHAATCLYLGRRRCGPRPNPSALPCERDKRWRVRHAGSLKNHPIVTQRHFFDHLIVTHQILGLSGCMPSCRASSAKPPPRSRGPRGWGTRTLRSCRSMASQIHEEALDGSDRGGWGYPTVCSICICCSRGYEGTAGNI